MKRHKHDWKRINYVDYQCKICEIMGALRFIQKWKKYKIKPVKELNK